MSLNYTYPGRPNECGGYHRTKYENGQWITERTRCRTEAPVGEAQCIDCLTAEHTAVKKRRPAASGVDVTKSYPAKKAGNW